MQFIIFISCNKTGHIYQRGIVNSLIIFYVVSSYALGISARCSSVSQRAVFTQVFNLNFETTNANVFCSDSECTNWNRNGLVICSNRHRTNYVLSLFAKNNIFLFTSQHKIHLTVLIFYVLWVNKLDCA